jgi:hypothetical protein
MCLRLDPCNCLSDVPEVLKVVDAHEVFNVDVHEVFDELLLF